VRRTPVYQLEVKAYFVAALDLLAGLVSLVDLPSLDFAIRLFFFAFAGLGISCGSYKH
jgi:hypothetical protein